MTIDSYLYKIPFTTPLKTSKQSFEYREGLILKYTSGGSHYYSEAAPLPGFSQYSLKEVISSLEKCSSSLAKLMHAADITSALEAFHQDQSLPPSLAFAIDSLVYQQAANQAGQSLREYLFEQPLNRIAVNALGNLLADDMIEDVRKKNKAGFQTFKFKIGINVDEELEILRNIRSQFPALTIRLDANQAWKPNQAVRHIQKLHDLNIEYIEEPLQESFSSHYKQLTQQINLPLAIDESLFRLDNWHMLLDYTRFVIIKPMLLGSFEQIKKNIELADMHKNKIIFTSTLECGIGRRITAILASGMGSKGHAHGLATGDLFAEDILADNDYIYNGYYQHLNDEQQLSVNPEHLHKISI